MNADEITEYLKSLSNKEIAAHSQRFFKTAKGEYGSGDKFLGIRVPLIRKAVKKYKDGPVSIAKELLRSPYHEIRLFALLSLVSKFEKGGEIERNEIFRFYLKNTSYINNWDLVDSSAHHIVGAYLKNKNRRVLYALAKSRSLWKKRIALMATFYFIKNNEFEDTLKIAEILLSDPEDLIHKAAGWMLREVGNRDKKTEIEFLNRHYHNMPRTMLRYAIEKFEKNERKKYLDGKV